MSFGGIIKKQYNGASYEPPQRFDSLAIRFHLSHIVWPSAFVSWVAAPQSYLGFMSFIGPNWAGKSLLFREPVLRNTASPHLYLPCGGGGVRHDSVSHPPRRAHRASVVSPPSHDCFLATPQHWSIVSASQSANGDDSCSLDRLQDAQSPPSRRRRCPTEACSCCRSRCSSNPPFPMTRVCGGHALAVQ